jgi:hypothetical protein
MFFSSGQTQGRGAVYRKERDGDLARREAERNQGAFRPADGMPIGMVPISGRTC